MTVTADQKRYAAKVVRRLAKAYPDADCALHFESPFQLLIATILSAQCTDERVNLVTQKLFKSYPTPSKMSRVPIQKLEQLVQSTGFFRNKAKNIRACSQELVVQHAGQVPRDMPALVGLSGVGRKTANVVLGTAYGVASGVVVDTHVGRISRRLGLSREDDPVKVEADLMRQLPQREWVAYSHRLIHHGRQVCKARRPRCDICLMEDICPRTGVS